MDNGYQSINRDRSRSPRRHSHISVSDIDINRLECRPSSGRSNYDYTRSRSCESSPTNHVPIIRITPAVAPSKIPTRPLDDIMNSGEMSPWQVLPRIGASLSTGDLTGTPGHRSSITCADFLFTRENRNAVSPPPGRRSQSPSSPRRRRLTRGMRVDYSDHQHADARGGMSSPVNTPGIKISSISDDVTLIIPEILSLNTGQTPWHMVVSDMEENNGRPKSPKLGISEPDCMDENSITRRPSSPRLGVFQQEDNDSPRPSSPRLGSKLTIVVNDFTDSEDDAMDMGEDIQVTPRDLLLYSDKSSINHPIGYNNQISPTPTHTRSQSLSPTNHPAYQRPLTPSPPPKIHHPGMPSFTRRHRKSTATPTSLATSFEEPDEFDTTDCRDSTLTSRSLEHCLNEGGSPDTQRRPIPTSRRLQLMKRFSKSESNISSASSDSGYSAMQEDQSH